MRLLDRIIGLIAGFGTRNPPLQPMQIIPEFPADRLPKEEIAQFTKDINTLINEYNNLTDVAEKRRILQKMRAKIQETDYKYSPCDIARSLSYRRVHASLFQAIKYQYASLGRPSLVESSEKPSPIAEVIANMAPEKADELLSILNDAAFYNLNSKLNLLYSPSDLSPEATAFRQFLSTHQISFLGGNNSKNFKVTTLRDNHRVVLKIDNRLDIPRRVEAHLRANVGDCFVNIEAERQVSCIDEDGTRIGRTLLVTEYCSEGDLNAYGATLNADEQEKKAAPLFEKMADIMLRIQEQRCIFPDAKITNWLVDDENRLCIADTKSFLFTDNKGDYYSDIPGNEYSDLIRTKGFTPPEFYNDVINADNCHAFILGKNLYNFLTDGITAKVNGANFDFDYPIFHRPLGPLYKELIVALVKPQAAARMHIKEAINQIFLISNPDCVGVFTELNHLKFGTHDEQMNDFIRKAQQKLNNASPEERTSILRNLDHIVLALKADRASSYVRGAINDFRERAGLFTIGMNAKAVRIEKAMSQLSIEDRCNLLACEELTEVMKAMASHRHLGKRGDVYLTERGQISTEDAAQTFKDFKVRFGNQIPNLDDAREVNYNRFM